MSQTGNKYSLKQSIWASKIRITPILETPICLSVQLYGCLWSEGLVSYTMPPNDIGEKDYYDGELENGVLKNGNNVSSCIFRIKKILEYVCQFGAMQPGC